MTETRSDHESGVAADGHTGGTALVPESAAELAEMLRAAAESQQAVAPRGAGVHAPLGNPLDRPATTLSTLKLSGIIEYEPTDLVVSVQAGTRFADLQETLGHHGQWLPIEAPDDDRATVGGLLATALNGPRQLGSGSLRDLLIGISVALPDGTVAKAGGMVVKNVTGFDMARLHYGALGTLGVITSANFKVLPMPKGERTVRFPIPDKDERAALRRAIVMSTAIRRSPLAPVALDILKEDGGWTLAVRIEGRPETFAHTTDRLRTVLGAEPSDVLDGTDSGTWWRRLLRQESLETGEHEALISIQTRPHQTGEVAERVLCDSPWGDAALTAVAISPGLGRTRVRLALNVDDAPRRFAEVIGALRQIAPRTTVLAAPEQWKRLTDVWGEPDEAATVMRSLRDQFDPNRILNPGRFLRGI